MELLDKKMNFIKKYWIIIMFILTVISVSSLYILIDIKMTSELGPDIAWNK
jgi:hypothetical protein